MAIGRGLGHVAQAGRAEAVGILRRAGHPLAALPDRGGARNPDRFAGGLSGYAMGFAEAAAPEGTAIALMPGARLADGPNLSLSLAQ
ncbi:hypothetical protein [Mangrovicoccus ximenensis]|uniref:hypothetical protein n=1 Tax=Mangrovicoccus ximenensis TaxID=1911570 RepID=UPI0011AEB1CF|nr:hypothetical protein [Mangrovicoccus ximenensis]